VHLKNCLKLLVLHIHQQSSRTATLTGLVWGQKLIFYAQSALLQLPLL